MPGIYIYIYVVKAKKDNCRFTLKIHYSKYVVRKFVLPDFINMYFPLRVLKPNFFQIALYRKRVV